MAQASDDRDRRYKTSRELFATAQGYLPGGNTRLTLFAHPHPIYVTGGKGCRVVDVDGNSYLDFVNNMSALIHGNAHPRILGAAAKAMESGTAFGCPTPSEIELSKLLVGRVRGVEQVRYTNSGSEAILVAVKAARAYTGKAAIAKFEGAYHGQYDYVEVSLKPGPETWGPEDRPNAVGYSRGVPEGVLRDVVVLPFNNTDACVRLLRENAGRLAAMVIDVMPQRGGLIPGRPEFLAALQEECRRLGIVFILDDVVNLRLDYGGSAVRYNLRPDVVCMAKIVGGGFPVGAVGGSKEVMNVFNPIPGTPALPHTGTYNANPVTMTAGLVSMQMLTRDAVERLNDLGAKLRDGLRRVVEELRVGWTVVGEGSVFRLHPTTKPLTNYRTAQPTPEGAKKLSDLRWGLLDRGVMILPGGYGYLSTPMGEGEMATAISAIRDTLAEIG